MDYYSANHSKVIRNKKGKIVFVVNDIRALQKIKDEKIKNRLISELGIEEYQNRINNKNYKKYLRWYEKTQITEDK